MFLFFIVLLVVIIVLMTSSRHHASVADSAFARGDINTAETHLKKVWTRRSDIPARLAGMYFELIKKGKIMNVAKALSLSTEGLSDEAKQKLESVQKNVRTHVEDKASAAFVAEDFDEAIRYAETLAPFGKDYKDKCEEYRVYKELKGFLSNGRKSPSLNAHLEANRTLVVKCIKNRVKETDVPHDALKLLSLALDDGRIKSMFNAAVVRFVLEHDRLPELRAEADKYQREFLEEKADNMPESKILDALKIYKALNLRKPKASLVEKIESLNYKRACACLAKDDYNGYRTFQSRLKANIEVTAGFRNGFERKYKLVLFEYLSGKLLNAGLNGEQWEHFLNCCVEYAVIEKSEEVLKIARELNAKGHYAESGKLCRLLDQSNPEVRELVCSDVLSILIDSDGYGSLCDVYDTDHPDVMPLIAERCFEHAKTLSGEGNHAKAVYLEKLAEPYFAGDDSKYDVFLKDYIIYAVTSAGEQLSSELDTIFGFLLKVSDRKIIEQHLASLEGYASSALSVGNAADAYEIYLHGLSN